jgi:hypothetical protein
MSGSRRVHDRAVLDALEAIDPESFEGTAWRVTRNGRDPLLGSSAHGRWSPGGEFEVLYTSLERQGALAEIGYRLSLEPVWPSLIAHKIHTIEARTERPLRFANVESLAPLGVDVATYEGLDYGATQAIAAAAHFLEFDGLLVPSARAACTNLVLFPDRATIGGRLDLIGSEDVDWTAWRKTRRRA